MPRVTQILKRLGDARDSILVATSCTYALGFLVWSLHAWRQGLGLLPISNIQYLVSGVAVLITLLMTYSLFQIGRWAKAWALRDAPRRARIVVNKATRGSIRTSDVERVLGVAPIASVRLDPAVRRAQERGELLGPHSGRAARDIERLASLVLEDLQPDTAEVS